MAKSPPIDKKRLLSDALKAERERPQPSVGRETIGIVRAIRDLLPTIRELRTQGVRWAAIAEALNAQSIYPDREGQPVRLTASRLTAIVSTLERRETQKQDRTVKRQERPGLVGLRPIKPLASSVALSLELQPTLKKDADTTAFESEEDLRRRALAEARSFLKDS